MEIIEEPQEFGSVGKTQRLVISRRDTIVNDLKNSTWQGLVSFVFSLVSVVVILGGFYLSFRSAGNSGPELGILMICAFNFGALAIVFGILGLKNRRKIRHYMERRGIILGFLCIAGLIAMYVRGILIYIG